MAWQLKRERTRGVGGGAGGVEVFCCWKSYGWFGMDFWVLVLVF